MSERDFYAQPEGGITNTPPEEQVKVEAKPEGTVDPSIEIPKPPESVTAPAPAVEESSTTVGQPETAPASTTVSEVGTDSDVDGGTPVGDGTETATGTDSDGAVSGAENASK